jgi:hypothetical protein
LCSSLIVYYSGHLARHNRIHTGEKNFHCLYPGCPSKFSRQDNMMQHYKTHVSSRSRLHYYYHYHYPTAAYKRPLEYTTSTFKREWSPTSSQSSYSSGASSPSYSPVQQQGYCQPSRQSNTTYYSNYYFEGYV